MSLSGTGSSVDHVHLPFEETTRDQSLPLALTAQELSVWALTFPNKKKIHNSRQFYSDEFVGLLSGDSETIHQVKGSQQSELRSLLDTMLNLLFKKKY